MNQQLVGIFLRGQELYRLLCCQQSQLIIHLPSAVKNHRVKAFEPSCMQDVNGIVEDSTGGARVEICVFPAIFKKTDPDGDSVCVFAYMLFPERTADMNLGRYSHSCREGKSGCARSRDYEGRTRWRSCSRPWQGGGEGALKMSSNEFAAKEAECAGSCSVE